MGKRNVFDTVRASGRDNIMYFDDSDSEMEEEEEQNEAMDDILRVAKDKDLASLAMAKRLKIQLSLVIEQLQKYDDSIQSFKHELHRKEEETMRQQHALRQIAIRRQLQLRIKKEISKREQNMVSIASVRGVSMRHKTSLSNLTKTQNEIDRVVQQFEQKDQNWKENISLQLNGNSKGISMGMDETVNSSRSNSVKSTKSQKMTQSVRSFSSDSRKSLPLQHTISLGGSRGRMHRSQSANLAPLSTTNPFMSALSEDGGDDDEKDDDNGKKKSFKAKWFGF